MYLNKMVLAQCYCRLIATELRCNAATIAIYFSSTYLTVFFKVTCEYKIENGAYIPTRVHTVVISIQHSEDVKLEQIRNDLMEKVIKHVIPAQYMDDKTVFHLNVSFQ